MKKLTPTLLVDSLLLFKCKHHAINNLPRTMLHCLPSIPTARLSKIIHKLAVWILLTSIVQSTLYAELQRLADPNSYILAQRYKNKTSQTFMYTRPVYRNIAAQQTIWHEAVYNKKNCKGLAYQILPLGQSSMGANKTRAYFLLDEQPALLVKGDDTTPLNRLQRDIRAEWLGLPANFSGTFTINPKQDQFGLWMEVNQNLKTFIGCPFLENIWISAALPFQVIQNDIGLTQSNIENPAPENGPGPHDILEALNQSDWLYAKFGPKQKESAFAEFQIKIGTTFMNHDDFEIGAYSGLILPLHAGQKAEHIFSPYIGNNRHFGYISGVHFHLPLTPPFDDMKLAFYADIENICFFRNRQHRTFDLRFKQWSRYLLFNNIDGRKNVPGANVLTRKVRVRPFNMVEVSLGLRANMEPVVVEFGYVLWAHGNEKVKLRKPFEDEWGIAGDGAEVPGTAIGATASLSTIKERAPNDVGPNGQPIFVPFLKSDIDFTSGTFRSALVHRAHFALGFEPESFHGTAFFAVGGFVELPEQNTALKNWGAWAKIGGQF